MAGERESRITRQPVFRDLQVLQFAAELTEDYTERKVIIERGLHNRSFPGIIGKFFVIDAVEAVGIGTEGSRFHYEDGLEFKGRGSKVGYWCDPELAIVSVAVEFSQPAPVVPEEVYDPELIEELEEVEAPVINAMRVPILAMRASTPGLLRAA